MKGLKRFLSALSAAILVSTSLAPGLAHADPVFSGYGAGTIQSPYSIATCAQLRQIDYNLAAHYQIVRDLDCSGSTFNHLASAAPFTGVLDGLGRRIQALI